MLATEVFQFRFVDNIITLLDSDSLMGAAQATVANSSFSKTMPVLPGELWRSTFMPFTIKHILKCHIGKYREAASVLQLWKALSRPFCTSDWVPQSEPFPTQKQQSNPRLTATGCVGEHFRHFSRV